MTRPVTELAKEYEEVIGMIPFMPFDLKLKMIDKLREALDEAYALGTLEGTRETCRLVEEKLGLKKR